jgi:hypothetical protein
MSNYEFESLYDPSNPNAQMYLLCAHCNKNRVLFEEMIKAKDEYEFVSIANRAGFEVTVSDLMEGFYSFEAAFTGFKGMVEAGDFRGWTPMDISIPYDNRPDWMDGPIV